MMLRKMKVELVMEFADDEVDDGIFCFGIWLMMESNRLIDDDNSVAYKILTSYS